MYNFFPEAGSSLSKYAGDMDRIASEWYGGPPGFLLSLEMIFHEFPDLVWLKGQISRGFSDRRGWGGHILEKEGFPSVIIHTESKGCYRPDIKGPLSFFVNLRGSSLCTVEGETRRIGEGCYFISNQAQPYTLQIEEGDETETFNIHLGDYFSSSTLHSLVTPVDVILDNGKEHALPPVEFFNQLYRRDAVFERLIGRIIQGYREQGYNKLLFEEQLTDLLSYQLRQQEHIARAVQKLPSVRAATRVQLYKQLSRAMDVIHASPDGAVGLEELAVEAYLSKYHFLRLFRMAYGYSPYQYMQRLRIEKACAILSGTDTPVFELADLLGFRDSQSFTRLFTQRMGVSPTGWRAMVK